MDTVQIPDQQLKTLGFRAFAPLPPLQKYIQCFWAISRKDKLALPIVNRLAPDGGIGIIFNLGSPLYRYHQSKPIDYKAGSIVAGTTSHSVNMGLTGEINAFGVRFHPGRAYPFIRTPIHELTDQVVSLDDIEISISETHFGMMAEAVTLEQKVTILQNLLLAHLRDFNHKTPLSLQSIDLIKKSHGLMKIEDLAKQFGMSRRNYERQFKTNVGLTPKRFSGIVRVQAARFQIKTQRDISLTDVGYATGFYDQAHFIREFKSIMNLTPKEYLLEKRQHTQ